MTPIRRKKSPPKKKLHDDQLSPPKKSHFSISALSCSNPDDPHSDLYWDSPTSRTASQFVVQLLDEKEEISHKKKQADSKRRSPASSRPSSRQASTGRKSPARSPSPEAKDGVGSLKGKIRDIAPSKLSTSLVTGGAFTSSVPQMTEEEQKEFYSKTYPFNYLPLEDFKATADSIERVYEIESYTGIKAGSVQSKTMEAVVLYCRYLEDSTSLVLKNCVFVDCMGYGGETCLYASAFHFHRIIDIELTEASRQKAKDIIKNISGLSRQCSVLVGTLRDYFPYDAQIYYMDCGWVCDGRSFVDEGALISIIFKLCEKIEATGAYLALLTSTTELDPVKDYDAPHMHILLRSKIHFELPDEATCWFFKIVI